MKSSEYLGIHRRNQMHAQSSSINLEVRCEIYLELMIKTAERCQGLYSGVFVLAIFLTYLTLFSSVSVVKLEQTNAL